MKKMRKLCLAVIILSFLGFGPLKSLFHNEISTNGDALVKKLTESSGLSSLSKDNKAENYLVLEGDGNKGVKQTGFAMLIKQDAEKKWTYEPITISVKKTMNSLTAIKKEIKRNDNIAIDHCFIIDFSGMARIIDLLAPNGVKLTNLKTGQKVASQHALNGREIVALIDSLPSNSDKEKELSVIFSSLKKEAAANFSAEEMMTIAPEVINEVMKSVKTDLSKGELIGLGISAIMNPVNTSESIQKKAAGDATNPVNVNLKPLPLHN
jgi:anionic cell wall polymer biosynthesis LytR-Cps2A-Psr (LCP) family protein